LFGRTKAKGHFNVLLLKNNYHFPRMTRCRHYRALRNVYNC